MAPPEWDPPRLRAPSASPSLPAGRIVAGGTWTTFATKALLDLLVAHQVIADDSLVASISAHWDDTVAPGRIVVEVKATGTIRHPIPEKRRAPAARTMTGAPDPQAS